MNGSDSDPFQASFESGVAEGGDASSWGGIRPSLETSLITVDSKLNQEDVIKEALARHPRITVGCRKCGKTHTFLKPCGDRLCIHCAKKRQKQYQKFLWKKYVNGDLELSKLKMITLTLESFQSCTKMIDWLFSSMRRLRQQDCWTRFAKGVYSMEIAKGKHGWHVHAHILTTGYYLHYKTLKRAWMKATKRRGKIVDIRAIRGKADRVFREACKYPFKPHNIRFWTTEDKQDFRRSVRRRRLFSPIGKWYGEEIKSEAKGRCIFCDSEHITYLEPSGITKEFWEFQYSDK